MEEFHRAFSRGIYFMVSRRIGYDDDLEESVQECIVTIIDVIQRGGITDPERLPGLVWTIVGRHISGRIREKCTVRATQQDVEDIESHSVSRAPSQEERIAEEQIRHIARKVLQQMEGVGRDVLWRFYVLEESVEQICGALAITPNQFRNLKTRAKDRFGQLCRQEMRLRPGASRDGWQALDLVA